MYKGISSHEILKYLKCSTSMTCLTTQSLSHSFFLNCWKIIVLFLQCVGDRLAFACVFFLCARRFTFRGNGKNMRRNSHHTHEIMKNKWDEIYVVSWVLRTEIWEIWDHVMRITRELIENHINFKVGRWCLKYYNWLKRFSISTIIHHTFYFIYYSCLYFQSSSHYGCNDQQKWKKKKKEGKYEN